MKVGRNDPCPCGSGLKYKKCCAEKDRGESSATGPVMGELAELLQGQNFESIEDVNAFMRQLMGQRNEAGIDDFQGLSPDHMHRFLYSPFDSPEYVTFPANLPSPPEAPILSLFRLLAEGIGEDGVKATATGNLPRNLVRQVADLYLGEEKYQQLRKIGELMSERDFRQIHAIRIIAEWAKLVRKYKGKFILSKECRKLLAEPGQSRLYLTLFRTMTWEFEWSYQDRYPDLPFIQQSFLFSLYLLSKYGGEWRNNTFYEDCFLRAFPQLLADIPERMYTTPEQELRGMYSLRVLERYAAFVGLIEIKHPEKRTLDRTFQLRKLPLLDQVVKFHD
jgi:hypothetical protein